MPFQYEYKLHMHKNGLYLHNMTNKVYKNEQYTAKIINQ